MAGMTQTDETSGLNGGRQTRRTFTWAALAFIILVGIALRLYRLDQQSLWYDEYISVSHVGDPDLLTCLRSQRELNWNMTPVYYTLQYLWANWIHDSIVSVRILSIIFGVLAMPLIYLIGRELFGRTAGLVAALCLALSSVHIYQAQEIRNYALTTLFALLSAYTFVNVIRGGSRRWWALHLAANALLVWTHLFGCFLLVAEGCFLLALRFRQPRLNFAWFATNLALTIPSLAWIRTINNLLPDIPPPPLRNVINNFIADCASPTFGFSIPLEVKWEVTPAAWTRRFELTYPGFDRALLVFFALGMVYLGYGALRSVLSRQAKGPLPQDTQSAAEAFFFLVFWVFLPGLVVLALSRIWRPDTMAAKYTTYSSLGVYLLAGGAVERLRRPPLKVCAVLILIVLFGHRLALTTTRPQRTDWRSATNQIKANSSPGDVVLVLGWVQDLVCRYNMRPARIPVLQAKTLEDLCQLTEAHLSKQQSVWAVCPVFGFEASEKFELYLALRDVAYRRKAYWSAMQSLFVFHVEPQPGFVPVDEETAAAKYDAAVEAHGAARRRMQDGLALRQRGHENAAMAAFRDAFELDPRFRPPYETLIGTLLWEKQDYAEVIALSHKAIEAAPDYSSACAFLGMAHCMQGDHDAALRAFRRATATACAGTGWVHHPFGNVLLERGDYAAAANQLRKAFEFEPDNPVVCEDLAMALLACGDNGARTAFRRFFKLNPAAGEDLEGLVDALLKTRDYDTAWRELRKLQKRGIPVRREIVDRLERDSGRSS